MTGQFAPFSPGVPLIFLDVDGVLNPHDFDPDVSRSCSIHRRMVGHLNFVIASCEARIVLTSAWRYLINRSEMNLAGMDWLLRSHGVQAGAIAGITHPDTPTEWDEDRGVPVRFVENERAAQVRRWRAAHGHVGPYVVIDDLDLGFSESLMPFVQTDGKVGLTMRDAIKAIGVLWNTRKDIS